MKITCVCKGGIQFLKGLKLSWCTCAISITLNGSCIFLRGENEFLGPGLRITSVAVAAYRFFGGMDAARERLQSLGRESEPWAPRHGLGSAPIPSPFTWLGNRGLQSPLLCFELSCSRAWALERILGTLIWRKSLARLLIFQKPLVDP